jgi:hypothetical protein
MLSPTLIDGPVSAVDKTRHSRVTVFDLAGL